MKGQGRGEMTSGSARRNLLGAVLMALAVVAHGRAQASGSITGTVTDTSGVPVAGVKVTIQDLETNAVRKVTTNSEGRYDAPSLQATVSSTTGHLEKVC